MESAPPGTPIILDIGSAYVKVGFAGDPKPREVFPCITGTEKYQTVMVDSGQKNVYVGHEAMKMRGVLKVKYPIQRGEITDWNDYYQILNYIFYTLLRIENLSNYPILYIENLFVPQETKEYIARVLFETHGVQSLLMVPAPLLTLISVGITTGLVVESGDGTTWSVPIINGKILHQGVQKLNLAGTDINNSLKTLLMREGINISSSAVNEIIKDIKEKNCYLILDPDKPPKSTESYRFPMPDGSNIEIPNHVFFEAPEVLFQPSMIGSNTLNIPQAVIASLHSIENVYWGDLLSHIVLSGGNLTYSGFEERFQAELNQLVPQLGPIPKPKPKHQKIELKQEAKLIDMEGINKNEDTCPQCGNLVDLSDGKTTCPFCGANMSLPKISISLNNVKVKEKSKLNANKCPHCGKEIFDKTSLFCPYCGKVIESTEIASLDEKSLGSTEIPVSKKEKIEKAPPNELSEYFEPSNLVYFYIPDNLQYTAFNGAAILGSLPSFKKLFITHEQFSLNKELLYRDISEIF
ncbi:MAG: zinc-ribbon domain-containing protein [Promethearchaeota archaeon]